MTLCPEELTLDQLLPHLENDLVRAALHGPGKEGALRKRRRPRLCPGTTASPTSAVEGRFQLFLGSWRWQVGVMSGHGPHRGGVVPTYPVAAGRRYMRSGDQKKVSRVSAAFDKTKKWQESHVLALGALGAS
jgi:hypothetical protein